MYKVVLLSSLSSLIENIYLLSYDLASLVAYTGFCLVYVQEALRGIKPTPLLLPAAFLFDMYWLLYHSAGCDSPRPVPTFFTGLLDCVLRYGPGLTLPLWFAP
jgi:hypothetical protein